MKVEFVAVENIDKLSTDELQTNTTRKARSSRTKVKILIVPGSENSPPKSKLKTKSKQDTKAKQSKYSCPLCKVLIPNKKAYEIHKTSHQNDETHECNICKQDFEDVDKLFTHLRKHENEKSERYQCNICQSSFVDINDLDSHIRLYFDLDIRYKCNICENSFFDIGHLVKHTDDVHTNILNITYSCYSCGQMFSCKDKFIQHDRNHKKNDGSLNCSECGEAFSSLDSLNVHKKTHLVPRAQPYACQKCNLRFSRSEDLHTHVRVHDGKAIFSCGICDRMFANSKNLANHVRKCHSSCFERDELDLIDFVVEAEVEVQLDHKKLEKVLSGDDAQMDGDVFKLDARELITRYTKKDAEPPSPVTTEPATLTLQPNVTRKLTEFVRKYKCPLCELIFVKAKTLEIHCKRNHFGNYTMALLKEIQQDVEQNNSQSFPRAILNARIIVVQKHECPSCDEIFKSRHDLIDHLKSCHNGDVPFKCIKCAASFATSKDLLDHVSHHSDKRHECKYCGLTFMNLYSLAKHSKRHEGPNTESCSICNIPYRETKDLMKHMRTHADGKPHKCLYCDKHFAQSCDRQKHMRIHTGEKPYVCGICGKSFAHLTSIKKHNFVHTGERAFQCTICGKSFQHSSNLVVHNRTHSGERPYKCKVCQKTFYASGHYVDHMKIHTGIKNYECQVCKKSFIHLSSFQKHKRVHSGEKPYACQLCNRAFSQSGHFREHMMIHSGEKPHKCDVCQKCFRRSDALQCHKKTHRIGPNKKSVVESTKPPEMLTTYPLNDIEYLPNENVVQYDENRKQDLFDQKMIIQDQSLVDERTINSSQLIDNVNSTGMVNMESSTITVIRPHQMDMNEQAFNTFSYNFIL